MTLMTIPYPPMTLTLCPCLQRRWTLHTNPLVIWIPRPCPQVPLILRPCPRVPLCPFPWPLIILTPRCSCRTITTGLPSHLAHQSWLHTHLHPQHLPTMPRSTALTRIMITMPHPFPLVSKAQLIPVPPRGTYTCTTLCVAMDAPTVMVHASPLITN